MCSVYQPGTVRGLFTSINNHDRWVFHLSHCPSNGKGFEDFPPGWCTELVRLALEMSDVAVYIKGVPGSSATAS